MKIAVIGGGGYLGHHVTKYFGADSFSRRNGFDITQPQGDKLAGYDVIIHMAAKVDKSGKNDEEVFEVNSGGTENIVRSLNKGQTFIFTSTKEIYTPENDSYGASKLEAESCIEKYAKEIGFRSGIFRLSTTYAPSTYGASFVNHFVDSVKNGKQLTLLANGAQKRDFLYVDDLSRAFDKFIHSESDNSIYDIGGGIKNSLTIRGLVEKIGEVTGKFPIISSSEDIPKGQFDYITDIKKIGDELKWDPIVSIEEGIGKIL